MDHKHYNPTIDTVQYRKAFKRTLNVQVPLVHPRPYRGRASIVDYKLLDFENRKPFKPINDCDLEVIYDRFVKDVKNEKEEIDALQFKELQDKMLERIKCFHRKIYDRELLTDMRPPKAPTPQEE